MTALLDPPRLAAAVAAGRAATRRRRRRVLTLLALLVVGLAALDVLLGSYTVTLPDLVRILAGE